jgi:peptide/nickel transport system substrate-binding protein
MRVELLRLLAGISAIGVACAIAPGGFIRGETGGASPAPTNSLPFGGGLIDGTGVAGGYVEGAERREGLKTLPYNGYGSERPRFGGTLRVEMGVVPGVHDFASAAVDEEETEVVLLAYETLVRLDSRGDLQPWLAESWEHDASMRRWKFHLRAGVRFHDGTPLGPQTVIPALINADQDWRLTETTDGFQIETPEPAPDLPVTLTQNKYVLIRRSGNILGGTGAFKVDTWDAGKHAVFVANLDYWGGRPFLDSVDVQMGRTARERMIDLEVGKADLIEMPVETARQAEEEKLRVETSAPTELLAVIFPPGRAASDNARLRQGVSRSIDRAAIVKLVLQKQGEPARGLLPQWISGTEFLFPEGRDLTAARALAKETPRALVLGYDANDSVEQAVAERIAVNAREADIHVTTTAIAATPADARPAKAKFDARLVRVSLISPLPRVALAGLMVDLAQVLENENVSVPENADAAEIYARENAVIETYRVIPIAHVPRVYGLGPLVRNFAIAPGTAMRQLPLADVWLEREAQ